MAAKRTLGLTILGVIFIVVGGLTVLTIFFEVLDSINRYGMRSIAITNYEAFRGFFMYMGLPIILYSTGIGILLLQAWARKVVLYVIPVLTLIFLGIGNISIFGLLFLGLMVIYFSRPAVRRQFD